MIKDLSFHNFLEEPWKKSFLHLMRPTVMQDLISNDELSFSVKLPGFLQKNWNWIDGNTLVDPFRMGTIIDLFVETKDLEGDILEFGSYKGGTGILLGLLVKEFNLSKKVHLFDSFSGLPDPNSDLDKGYRKGQFKSNYEKLNQLINDLDLQNIITIQKGWFNESLPKFLTSNPAVKISLLHIDCDLYDSTKDCFPVLDNSVVSGGAIIFDDFNDGGRGEKIAVLETFNKSDQIQIGPAPQTYTIKSQVSQDSEYSIEDAGFSYNFESLLSNQDYLNWLDSELGHKYKSEFLNVKKSKMSQNQELKQIEGIISEILERPVELSVETKASDVEDWDSINHILIIVEIEKKFSVRFSSSQVESFKNVGDIINGIKNSNS